ncbi:hypothetical protein ACFYOD_06475 [Streptomyces sp. NPDC006703]|uniref:hypothetical protein n=1 Tax=Streptomyces sp. NPDC006703 TaxID=3364759 RepID=UPI003681CC61
MTINGRHVALAAQAMIISATGRACGYGSVPAPNAQPTGANLPYTVLYELGQDSNGPAFGDMHGDARVLLQVTSAATSAELASALADRVRAGFLGRTASGWAFPLTPASGVVIDRDLDQDDGTSVAGSVYSYVQRFALTVTTVD